MLRKIIFGLVFAAIAASASAQDPFHPPGPFAGRTLVTLSLFEEVRTEIKSTSDENSKEDALLEKIQGDMQEVFQNAGGDPQSIFPQIEKINLKYDEELGKILTADQMTRLKQLFVQFNGTTVATNPTFAKDLSLTDDQKAKVKTLQSERVKKMQEAFGAGGDPGDMQKAVKKMQDEFNSDIEKLLTDGQKAKLKTMAGTKFEFKKVEAGG